MKIIHRCAIGDIIFCFAPVYSLEPFVKVIALHRESGELSRLNDTQLHDLTAAVKDFIKRHGLTDEKYSATLNPPRECPTLAEAIAHQHDHQFSLFIRVASAMYRHKMPLLAVLPYDALRPVLANLHPTDAMTQLSHVCPYLRTFVRCILHANGPAVELGQFFVPLILEGERVFYSSVVAPASISFSCSLFCASLTVIQAAIMSQLFLRWKYQT